MSAATAPTATTATTVEPLPPPRTIINSFSATERAANQRAATEGRLDPLTDYPFAELMPRTSLIGVLGGVLGFLTFMVAVPLTVHTYLGRLHQPTFQLAGFTLFMLIVLNLGLGYGASLAHEWLHATTCRLMGGNPQMVPAGQYRFVWSAKGQGFTRASYAVVLLAPLVILTALWAILLITLPNVAAYLIVALVINMAMSGADLWTAIIALRQPPKAAVFADRHPGFVAYAIAPPKAAPKPVTKKPTTPIQKKKPGR